MNIIKNLFDQALNLIFSLTGDWGIAIIILTLAVKILLTPLSMKQKHSLYKQNQTSQELDAIKEKYKNSKEMLDTEMLKYYRQNSKGMLGCLMPFLQIPIVFSLYNVILGLPAQVSTLVIPWISSIKFSDNHFIVPLIYSVITLAPNLLPTVQNIKTVRNTGISPATLMITSIFSLLLTVKAPIALGIYFITSAVWSFIEEILFRIYVKYKLA